MGGFVFIVVVISPLVKLRSARARWSLQSQLFFVFVFVSLFHFSTKRARFQLLHALYWQKSADHCCVLFVQPVTVTQWAHWVWSVTPVAASVRVNPTWLVDTVTSVRQEHMDLAPRDASVCFFPSLLHYKLTKQLRQSGVDHQIYFFIRSICLDICD